MMEFGGGEKKPVQQFCLVFDGKEPVRYQVEREYEWEEIVPGAIPLRHQRVLSLTNKPRDSKRCQLKSLPTIVKGLL